MEITKDLTAKRMSEPAEKLDKMIAHTGTCRYCGFIVKMPRDTQGHLKPQHCYCLKCGQWYFMEINNIEEWEIQQWEQKSEK